MNARTITTHELAIMFEPFDLANPAACTARACLLELDCKAQDDVEQVKRALDRLVCAGPVHIALIASYLAEHVHNSGWSHFAEPVIEALGDVDHACRDIAETQEVV